MNSTSKTLSGKNALVTGSGTGIGREVALEFARQGANVVLHYSNSSEGATGAVEEARKLGVKAEAFKSDFSQLDEVIRLGDGRSRVSRDVSTFWSTTRESPSTSRFSKWRPSITKKSST